MIETMIPGPITIVAARGRMFSLIAPSLSCHRTDRLASRSGSTVDFARADCPVLSVAIGTTERKKGVTMRGAGRVVFAAIVLLIVGTINIIYGIGALDDANYFVNDTRFILDNLNTLGWVLIILGVIQLTGGFSLMAGNVYGRVIGIIGGSLGAIGALLSIGQGNPWWSLGVFFLCVYVVHGIVVYGEDERRAAGV
jgi:hypothetical protein